MEKTTRNLTGGEVLVAKYRGKTYKAAVLKTEDGIRIGLPDGRMFTSVSAAGQAIMKHACNGHRFWAVETEAAKPAQAKKPKARAKRSRAKTPAAQQEPQPEGVGVVVLIPDFDPDDPKPYPGGIEPGEYNAEDLLREHKDDPEALQFITDMMEV